MRLTIFTQSGHSYCYLNGTEAAAKKWQTALLKAFVKTTYRRLQACITKLKGGQL